MKGSVIFCLGMSTGIALCVSAVGSFLVGYWVAKNGTESDDDSVATDNAE